jgi:hypothetical protein
MLDLGTPLLPNRFTFNRFTATCVWYPGSAVPAVDGGYHLGVIEGQMLDEGIAREKVPNPIDGAVNLLFDEAVSVAPIWTLKGRQFMTTILPLLHMGTAGSNQVQGAGSTSRPFTAYVGKTIDIGSRNISAVTVTDTATGLITYIEGLDYFLNAPQGLIRFPNSGGSITDGEGITIAFTKPALSRETYVAFNNLNQSGNLQLFLMDAHFQPPAEELFIPGVLSRDKGNTGDPMKTDMWQLRFACEGQPNVLRIGQFDEWLYT